MSRRALIVEDGADMALVLEAALEGQGFATETAGSGHAALEAARRLRPDVITLDLGLPDIDGLEVCRTLRSFTDAYIVIISGTSDEEHRLEGLEFGADDFLTKPVNPRELAARVEALMRRPRAASAPRSELETAAQVQRGLLPERAPVMPGYDVAGACRPSRSVGGDFFDWESDGDVLAVTLADAMGKGMGAALVAATARAALRGGRLERGAAAIVRRAADTLESDLQRLSTFITLLHLRLQGATGRVDYIDAGHGLGMLVHADGSWERVVNGGPPLGLMPGAVWTGAVLTVEPGSAVAVISDGVLDAFETLDEALEAVASTIRGSERSADAVDAILQLAPDAEDDVTAVVLRRKPEEPAEHP
ncbi:SpoIIE family protein phosphatase [Sinomonas mesophila]|uniref:SpoIIE family protein phosphatase n=1 Tax=Sinomonas mesophila TaxID=1531955 RepID=UPI000985B1DF|nr:SpoIIE family protein phosphatase [Sinomonas mesophila]